jgi:protein-disulfide isomerase
MNNNNILLLATSVVALLLSAILIVVILFIDVANLAYAKHQQQSQNVTLIQKLSTLVNSNASALGSSDAPVTLIEFGDYQCAACYEFHADTNDLILTNLVKTGKVKFLFKDFPILDLPTDSASTLASEASYCAADQGKYWQYHDKLYNSWQGENTGWITKASLTQFAISIGIKNIKEFSQCLDSGKYAAAVAANFNLAGSIGLTATPSFVLISNNSNTQQQLHEIVGAQPYAMFANTVNIMTAHSRISFSAWIP